MSLQALTSKTAKVNTYPGQLKQGKTLILLPCLTLHPGNFLMLFCHLMFQN